MLALTAQSQKVKHIVEEDYELFCRNEYDVLKIDKATKHGHYVSTWVNGNPRMEGHYSFGLKDSMWIYFNPYKPIIGSRGFYEEDKKIGVWEYFNDKGEPMNRYNHSTGALLYSTHADTNKTHIIKIADTLARVKVERPAFFLHGELNQFRIIQGNIKYPQEAIDLNIYGTVEVTFCVDIYGKTKDHSITKSIGGGCDEEALRVVQMIPDEWVPGVYQNALVEVMVTIPITFQLN